MPAFRRVTIRVPMQRLAHAAELLDGPLDDPAALAGNLRDLRRINRWLGGVSLSRRAIAALAAHRTDLTLLDVGTGGADIPIALLGEAERRGRRIRAVATDSRGEVLVAARSVAPRLAELRDLELRVSDGRSLPYPDRSFDVAHASLVLHHLEPADAVILLREMARVARLGVVVNDLARGRLPLAGAWLVGHLLTGNRYTRHDAPLSVRRAYALDETRGLLGAAELRPVSVVRGAFGHRYAIAAVPATDGLAGAGDG